jgi:hypothetical protein
LEDQEEDERMIFKVNLGEVDGENRRGMELA